MCNTSNAL